MKVGERYRLKCGYDVGSSSDLGGKYFTIVYIENMYVHVRLDGRGYNNHIRIDDWEMVVEKVDFKPIKNIPKLSLTV